MTELATLYGVNQALEWHKKKPKKERKKSWLVNLWYWLKS